jgi:hypothetical protein
MCFKVCRNCPRLVLFILLCIFHNLISWVGIWISSMFTSVSLNAAVWMWYFSVRLYQVTHGKPEMNGKCNFPRFKRGIWASLSHNTRVVITRANSEQFSISDPRIYHVISFYDAIFEVFYLKNCQSSVSVHHFEWPRSPALNQACSGEWN